ncbi:MAG TPA: hypothetical protein VJA16_14080 [Thermoanaerobaculia bacterium]
MKLESVVGAEKPGGAMWKRSKSPSWSTLLILAAYLESIQR